MELAFANGRLLKSAGRCRIPALRRQTEYVICCPTRLWNSYEAGYREDLVRLEANRAGASEQEKTKVFPLTYSRKYRHITVSCREGQELFAGFWRLSMFRS